VARLLLEMLPPELAAIDTPEERAAEYMDYRQFFIAWETLERATECQALEEAPQMMSRNTHAAWVKDYGVRTRAPLFSLPSRDSSSKLIANGMQGLVSSVREQILKLLTMDWLVPESDVPTGT
jgi:nuclear pore complex protein Nup107